MCLRYWKENRPFSHSLASKLFTNLPLGFCPPRTPANIFGSSVQNTRKLKEINQSGDPRTLSFSRPPLPSTLRGRKLGVPDKPSRCEVDNKFILCACLSALTAVLPPAIFPANSFAFHFFLFSETSFSRIQPRTWGVRENFAQVLSTCSRRDFSCPKAHSAELGN